MSTAQYDHVIFYVEGGLGKNVASTAVVKAIKKEYPSIPLIVVCSWPEIFVSNPNIDRLYRIGNTPYFYDNYIKDQNPLILRHEPYFQTNHILKKTSLIETWCNMYNLPYSDDIQPELFMNMIQRDIAARWQRGRPIMVIQTNGGPMQGQKLNYSWTRDMPIAVSHNLVRHFSEKYHIIQVCREESQSIPGVEVVFNAMSNFELFSLLRVSEKRVLIDSCLQHAAAAYKLPSTVLWIGTSPTVFGYSMHNNVLANPSKNFIKLVDSFLFDYSLSGEMHECPYSDMSEIFSFEQIVASI